MQSKISEMEEAQLRSFQLRQSKEEEEKLYTEELQRLIRSQVGPALNQDTTKQDENIDQHQPVNETSQQLNL